LCKKVLSNSLLGGGENLVARNLKKKEVGARRPGKRDVVAGAG